MNKDLKQEKPKEEIKSDNRYNRKLLNQAYKKAKKAREVEKKNKRKKKFLRIFIYTLIPIVLISIVLSIFFLLPKNIDFIEAVELIFLQLVQLFSTQRMGLSFLKETLQKRDQ
ncbi:MAG: hypothetical protein UR36_C0011G0014 [candidate division WS6 bacterium GW2011_GWF1_33_233]|nr:MAG: hypothetical protein UR36_C0011G0014 [candidate division WS6 bacterium GW2011_GWF1_33_233]